MNTALKVCFNLHLPGNSTVINVPYCAQYHGGLGTAGCFTYSILCGIRAKMYAIKQVNIHQEPLCFDDEMSPEELKTFLYMNGANFFTFLDFLQKQTFEEM